ncbi:COP9 signalosome complex subunit 12, partial [Lecanoromycetidae sp. Uapishka_2]
MEVLFRDFQAANAEMSGPLLAATIAPIAPPNYLNRLDAIYKASNADSISRDVAFGLTKSAHAAIQFPNPEIDTWTEIYSAYWYAIGGIIAAEQATSRPDWQGVYNAWKDLANTVIKGYSSGVLEAWTLPVLYIAGKHLRIFAIKADESAGGDTAFKIEGLQEDIAGDYGKNQQLEDAARVINRMFMLCHSDRAPLEESRKWGLYYTTNLLFKTYFKLNSIGLSKNCLRAISASKMDMPDLDAFPRSHIVTFKYYVGVIQFLEEDYVTAEENLTSAWHICHRSASRNIELILIYLIPTLLLTKQRLPSSRLLSPYPRLARLFTPLVSAIRSGSLSAFDAALAEGEAEFVKRRIYLTLERGRDICLRNLLRKVFLAAGVDEEGKRRTRIKVDEFSAAIRVGERIGEDDMTDREKLENEEVECLVANMIYKNLMKGYISRAHGTVVLSKNGAFPGTGI